MVTRDESRVAVLDRTARAVELDEAVVVAGAVEEELSEGEARPRGMDRRTESIGGRSWWSWEAFRHMSDLMGM